MGKPNEAATLVPGFDFLQNLTRNAGAALPGIGQWVAPTVDPDELAKRIEELRTVQFWLEQNARMLAATIQALEVQRMTLSTLKTMNVHLGDFGANVGEQWRQSLTKSTDSKAKADKLAAKKTEASGAPTVDPMQWWNALTQQFTQLAAGVVEQNRLNEAAKPVTKAAAKSSRRARPRE